MFWASVPLGSQVPVGLPRFYPIITHPIGGMGGTNYIIYIYYNINPLVDHHLLFNMTRALRSQEPQETWPLKVAVHGSGRWRSNDTLVTRDFDIFGRPKTENRITFFPPKRWKLAMGPCPSRWENTGSCLRMLHFPHIGCRGHHHGQTVSWVTGALESRGIPALLCHQNCHDSKSVLITTRGCLHNFGIIPEPADVATVPENVVPVAILSLFWFHLEAQQVIHRPSTGGASTLGPQRFSESMPMCSASINLQGLQRCITRIWWIWWICKGENLKWGCGISGIFTIWLWLT